MAEQLTPEQRAREQREQAADGVQRRRRAMDEAQASAPGQGKGLDTDKVAEIRRDLAAGGDAEVEKRHGKAAATSAEARKAKIQRNAVRKHESRLREQAAGENRGEQDKKAAEQNGRPPAGSRLSPQEARERVAQGGKDLQRVQKAALDGRQQVRAAGMAL